MNDNDKVLVLSLSLLAASVFIVIFALLFSIENDENTKLKDEAIKRGYAEFVVIGENKTQLRWK